MEVILCGAKAFIFTGKLHRACPRVSICPKGGTSLNLCPDASHVRLGDFGKRVKRKDIEVSFKQATFKISVEYSVSNIQKAVG